jgi:hypothetical protein
MIRGLGRVIARSAVILTVGLGAPSLADDLSRCPGAPVSAQGGLPVPQMVSQETFDALVGWIALNTSYEMSLTYNDPPTLSFCSIGEIVAYEDHKLLIEEGLLAAFDYPNRYIYLVAPWSKEDRFDLSILLHELIHDAQLSNRDWDCLRQPETEAYILQDKWLRQQGVYHPFDWRAILEMSRCTKDGS